MSALQLGAIRGGDLWGITLYTNDGSCGDTERWSLSVMLGSWLVEVKWLIPEERFVHNPRMWGFSWERGGPVARWWNENPYTDGRGNHSQEA